MAKADPLLPDKALWPEIIAFLMGDPSGVNTTKKRDYQVRTQFNLPQQDVELLFKTKDFNRQWAETKQLWNEETQHVTLAHKRNRLELMEEILEKLPDERTQYKLKIIEMARIETDDSGPDQHLHLHGQINAPPQAKDHEEWLRQNEAEAEVMDDK